MACCWWLKWKEGKGKSKCHLETNGNNVLAVVMLLMEQSPLERSIPNVSLSDHGLSQGMCQRGCGWLTLRGRRHPPSIFHRLCLHVELSSIQTSEWTIKYWHISLKCAFPHFPLVCSPFLFSFHPNVCRGTLLLTSSPPFELSTPAAPVLVVSFPGSCLTSVEIGE